MEDLEGQKLGKIARLSVVSTSEQVKAYVDSKITGSGFIKKSGDSDIGTLTLSSNLEVGKNAKCGYINSVKKHGSVAAGDSSYVTPRSCMAIKRVSSESDCYVIEVDPTLSSVLTQVDCKKPIALQGDNSSIYANPQIISRIDAASGKIYFKKDSDITHCDTYRDSSSVDTYFTLNVGKTPSDHYILFYHQPELNGNYTYNAKGPAYSFGEVNTVMCDDSVAIGALNNVVGRSSTALGFRNDTGHFGTAIGGGNKAYAKFSIALGCNTATNTSGKGDISNVIILNPARNAFAWSAGEGQNDQYIISSYSRARTFNINPKGGATGFYIGNRNLPSIVREIVDGVNVSDSEARIISFEYNGDTLINTYTAEAFVDEYVDKFKPTYDDVDPEEKTQDEIKEEVEHIYAMTKESDDEFSYFKIVVAKDDENNTYSWQKVTEKAKVSYIKKEGDSNIGPLHLSGNISVDGNTCLGGYAGFYLTANPTDYSNHGWYNTYDDHGNQLLSCYSSVAAGSGTKVYSDASHAEGWRTIAGGLGIKVVALPSGYDVDGKPEFKNNLLSCFSVKGLSVGMPYSARFGSNYDMLGTILSINFDTNVISCSGLEAVSTKNLLTAMQFNTLIDNNLIYFPGHEDVGHIQHGEMAHAEGIECVAANMGAHAEGNECKAYGKYAHAEGYRTIAGYASHAEGYQTSAIVMGKEVPPASMHAEGQQTKTSGKTSHADGVRSHAKDDYSYAWNGVSSYMNTSTAMYQTHGTGTFNINPVNGTKGFYIGDDSLFNILSSSQSNALSSITFETSKATDVDYLVNMLSTVISVFGGKIV